MAINNALPCEATGAVTYFRFRINLLLPLSSDQGILASNKIPKKTPVSSELSGRYKTNQIWGTLRSVADGL